jgi:hypothetical protein
LLTWSILRRCAYLCGYIYEYIVVINAVTTETRFRYILLYKNVSEIIKQICTLWKPIGQFALIHSEKFNVNCT